MSKPFISCVCCYHGRNWVLEEAIESYRRQDYDGPSELLIVNDCVEQTVACYLPGVRCINLEQPIQNLSQKFDRACELAAGDYIAWWEDDDISMPWRLSTSAAAIGDAVCYKQQRAPWFDGSVQPPAVNLFMGSALHRRGAFLLTAGQSDRDYVDQGAWRRLRASGRCIDHMASNENMFFLYRWSGINVYHDSGQAINDPGERFRRFHAATLANPQFVQGSLYARPRWRTDYVAMWKQAAAGWPDVGESH